jgi:ketosteroid isomerase-like protein
MTRSSLDSAIAKAARTGDLASLASHLADDVELHVAITVHVPPPLRRAGKLAVLEQLRGMGRTSPHAPREPRELVADGDRIVALCDGGLATHSGVTIPSECALVFDVRGDSIARLGLHFELRPALQGPASDGARMPVRRERSDDDDVVAAEVEV